MNFTWMLQIVRVFWPSSSQVAKDSRQDFRALNEAQQKAHERELRNMQLMIDRLLEDLDGVRKTIRDQDAHISELRKENQQLHQQHLNCEQIQKGLESRVAELEAEVKRLNQRPTGGF